MAVDIKSLRIGSHILVDGKRERVRGLDEDNGLIIRFPAEYVNANEIEPIPITPALLKELGLRKEDGFMRLWSKDDNGHFYYIEFSAIRDKWRLYPSGTDGSNTVVRYLHEAESFLALHNIELMEE